MKDSKFEDIDWGSELQELVAQAKPEDRKAAFAFAQALHPYLDDPTLLRTLLGKIMQSPSDVVGVIAKEKKFESLEEIESKLGSKVKVIPL